jgi:hypothetical protein
LLPFKQLSTPTRPSRWRQRGSDGSLRSSRSSGTSKLSTEWTAANLKVSEGYALHAVLCAAGYSIRWLLRMIVKKGRGPFVVPVADGGFDRFAEEISRNHRP